MRHFFVNDFFPKFLAGIAIEAIENPLINFRRLLAKATATAATSLRRGRRLLFLFGIDRHLNFGAGWNCRLDKDFIAPNDWRCRAGAGDFHFPFDVFFFAPLGRRMGRSRNAVALRAAPLRPILCSRLSREEGSAR